jgi:Zn-dependent protease with chaperone function
MNPTERIELDFPAYVARSVRVREQHLIDGTPDYSFALDNTLRRRLTAIPALRAVARLLVRAREPFFQQLHMMNSIAVGPSQLPEVFAIGQRCARTLGIGVPQIFVQPSETSNAYTYASDDVKPSIIITTRLMRSLEPDELMAVIGHECGHIHNLHMAYNTLVELMSRNGAGAALRAAAAGGAPLLLLQFLARAAGTGLSLFMMRWSRCAEITCDRAGVICAGSVSPMIRGLIKLQTGGEIALDGVDVDAYVRQLESVKSSLSRFAELTHSHPLTQKRIEALRLFHNSEALLAWRPELRVDGPVRTRAEVDAACDRLISVFDRRRSFTEGETGYDIGT